MGDTFAPSEEGACLGRSVTSWTSGSGLWPACSRARRWRRCAPSSGSPARPATRSYDRYKDCGVAAFTDRSRRPLSPGESAAAADRGDDRAPEARVSRAGARRRSARSCGSRSTGAAAAGDQHRACGARSARPGASGGAGAGHARRAPRCRGRPSRTRCGAPTTKASSCSAIGGTAIR